MSHNLEITMSGAAFRAWLADMHDIHGLNKRQCGALLGRKQPWVSVCQTRGTDRLTALACAALLYGIGPYRSTGEPAVPSRPQSSDRAPA